MMFVKVSFIFEQWKKNKKQKEKNPSGHNILNRISKYHLLKKQKT